MTNADVAERVGHAIAELQWWEMKPNSRPDLITTMTREHLEAVYDHFAELARADAAAD